MAVSIVEVAKRKDLKRFITFPEKLYRDHPLWVPAMISDEYATLDRFLNPAFRHCEARYFLAVRDGETVGRVAAIINRNANRDWNERTVRFGWIDFIDDNEVSGALLDAVRQWGREKGMTCIKGPLGFSDMDKEGLLVEGFENLPSITTIYNYPYYGEHLERHGLVKDIDWTQRIMDLPDEIPERMETFARIVGERYGVRVMEARKAKDFRERAHEMFQTLNDCFKVLYEFTHLNDAQIESYINQYFPFIHKDFICIVLDRDDRVAGFAITLPSLSLAMRKARGRLFPFGFYHLLRGLRNRELVELLMIGIRPEYQNKGLNALIFDHLHRNFIRHGVKRLVTNPQLETNHPSLSLFDSYEMKPYMRRRSYRGEL